MFDEDDTDSAWWHQLEMDERYIREQLKEPDMKVSELTASKYLAKADFEDDQTVTIKGLRIEEFEDNNQKKEKAILYFREHAKGMVANNTTLRVLAQSFGDESDEWRGKQVVVYVDPNVSFAGKIVGGLRLRIPKQKAAAPTTPAHSSKLAPPTDEFNDNIPF